MAPKQQPVKADSQALPNKEAALFRQLIKQYESKMYKKAIKTADTILRKCPDNGETLAMKGLLLNCLERKEEAYDLVKRGVKANLRSHVCWHVYGLLYRSDRDYDEAIKCYKNALRMDRENLTVLRDLAQLQVQMRDLQGFLETRQALLEAKSSNRQHWVALALAHHLCGNYEVAATVVESFEATVESVSTPSERYEHSEILLYKVSILEEGKMFAEALEVLDAAEKRGLMRDRLGAMETRGRLLTALDRAAEAEMVFWKLININPEHHGYHASLVGSLKAQGAAGDQKALLATYADLQQRHPRSSAARRLPLDFLDGGSSEFAAAADSFVRRYLSKGIPSLFIEMKPLYTDPAKARALGEIMARIEAALAEEGEFPAPLDPAAPSPHHAGPQARVWTQLYLALHHDALGDSEKALRLVDAALAHTPTLIELHSARARILKHAGDLKGAAAAAQAARGMDLADRYLNSVAVKALFRAGEAEEAEKVAAMFTRDGDQANNLFDMQAAWYEVSSGRAYLARQDYGRALKRFLKVDSHFADFVEDQFDFHAYCLRKQTMRAYVDMLRMVDGLYRSAVYGKAVAGAVAAYLALSDSPPQTAEQQEAAKVAGMTPEEAKRYQQRKRKEEARKQKEKDEAAATAAAMAASAKKGGAEAKKPDPDPNGEALAATTDPLGEATKLVRRLTAADPSNLDGQMMAFEVYSRKGRLLLALQALKRAAAAVGVDHPAVHTATVRLAELVAKLPQTGAAETAEGDGGEAGASAAVTEGMVREQMASMLAGAADAAAFHAAWKAQHGAASLAHRLAAAKTAVVLQPEKKAEAAADLARSGPSGAQHAECVEAHCWLAEGVQEAQAAAEFAKACAAVFRLSRYFGGELCVALEVENGAAAESEAAVDGVAQQVEGLKLEKAVIN